MTTEEAGGTGKKTSDPSVVRVEEPNVASASRAWLLLFRAVGGLFLIVSVFLPFMSGGGYSLFSRVTTIVRGIVPMLTYFFSQPPEVVPRTVPAGYVLFIAGFVALVAGGLWCFRKGATGPIVGIAGVVMEIAAFSLFTGVSPLTFISGGPGYHMAATGSLTALLSRWLAVRPPGTSHSPSRKA